MNTKELLELQELEAEIDLELSDTSEADISYEVWLICWNNTTESDPRYLISLQYLIDTFDTREEAIKCADFFSDEDNIKLIKNKDHEFEVPTNVTASIEVDVISEDIRSTIYEKTFKII